MRRLTGKTSEGSLGLSLAGDRQGAAAEMRERDGLKTRDPTDSEPRNLRSANGGEGMKNMRAQTHCTSVSSCGQSIITPFSSCTAGCVCVWQTRGPQGPPLGSVHRGLRYLLSHTHMLLNRYCMCHYFTWDMTVIQVLV